MENIKHIDEAIYELGPDTVSRKKKSVVNSLIVLATGVTLVVAAMSPAIKNSENLYTASVFLGWTLILAGVIWALTVLFGNGGRAYYKPAKEVLKRSEMYYDTEKMGEVSECVKRGDLDRLAAIDGGTGASVMVVMYRGRKSGVAMCQLFRYVPHNYEPECEMLVFDKA